MTTLVLELRKLRRTRFWLMAAGAGAFQVTWLLGAAVMRSTGTPESRLAGLSLIELVSMAALVSPLVAALLASRLVTVDTEERMGQLMTALGQRASARWWGKVVVGSAAVVLIQLVDAAVLGLVAPELGLRLSPGYETGLLPTAVVLTCAAIGVVALQVTLSTVVDRQAISLVVASLATLACSSLPYLGLGGLGWFLPWGLVGAASPVDVVASRDSVAAGGDIALAASPWTRVLLAAAVTAVWVVLARTVVSWKEHRS